MSALVTTILRLLLPGPWYITHFPTVSKLTRPRFVISTTFLAPSVSVYNLVYRTTVNALDSSFCEFFSEPFEMLSSKSVQCE